MKLKILCLDDDPTIGAFVKASLRQYDVILATTIAETRHYLEENTLAAILIDINLPDGDGLRLLAELTTSTKFKGLPIIILSGSSDISKKVAAFNFGAEDFISKPFDPLELQARVDNKIRRRQEFEESVVERELGNLIIDLGQQKAFLIQQNSRLPLDLTSTELKILSLLTKRMGQVYSREQIIDRIWNNTNITDRTVDSHIAHLRKKLADTTLHIETSKSFGYRATLKV